MRGFEAAFRPRGGTRVLDVGGTSFNWQLAASRPRVTLLNLAVPADARALPERFVVVIGSGTELPYPDDAFDYVVLSQTLPAMRSPRSTLRAAKFQS